MILIVDDDPTFLDGLALTLEDAGHSVRRARDGRAALAAIDGATMVISDVNMPGMDGFSLCRKLRAAGSTLPILLLTARDTEIDEALGLELGADDYVSKPFSARVLLARVEALLRRNHAPAPTRRGALSVDVDRLEVRWNDAPLETTLTEFRLLEAVSRRPGVVRSRAWLMAEGRGDDSVVDPRIVDTYIRRLRRKLEAVDPTFEHLETVIGAGYRWKSEP